jgi:hypothetical protein
MPNDFYSGANTVVLPILHQGGGDDGSGEPSIHNIEVDKDVPLEDLHKALLRNDYHLPVSDTQPAESEAEENTQKFRDAANMAWGNAASGLVRKEAGFIDYKNQSYPNQVPAQQGTELSINMSGKNVLGSAHTHPNERQEDPSPADIDDAKKTGKWIWVVSRGGLYSVSPKGDVQHIYKSPTWFSDKNPK